MQFLFAHDLQGVLKKRVNQKFLFKYFFGNYMVENTCELKAKTLIQATLIHIQLSSIERFVFFLLEIKDFFRVNESITNDY